DPAPPCAMMKEQVSEHAGAREVIGEILERKGSQRGDEREVAGHQQRDGRPADDVGERRPQGAHRQGRRCARRYGGRFHGAAEPARFARVGRAGIGFAALHSMRTGLTQSEREGMKLALEPGQYAWATSPRSSEVSAGPIASDLPPIMILADHIGYAGGVRHGVTTYLLHVLPLLAAAGLEMTVCFLRGPHAAAADLRAHGIRPVFLDAGKWDPTVALRIAALAKRKGVRLLHATGVKGTLVARIAARRIGARTLLHVHDLNDPGAAVSALQRLFAQSTDAAVCVSQAVYELTVSRYHVRPERVRIARNGIPLEALRRAGAGARSRVLAELDIETERPMLA